MIYKTHTNNYFTLSMKIEIHENLQQINVLVILDNRTNRKRDMRSYLAKDFAEALKQYNVWEKFFFD